MRRQRMRRSAFPELFSGEMSGGTIPHSASSQVRASALRPLPDAIPGKPSGCNLTIIPGWRRVGTHLSARRGRRGEPHAAAHLPRPRREIVSSLDSPKPLENLRGHGSAAARLLAHVERHQLVSGGEIAVLRVEHLVEVMEALAVVLEEEGGEAEGITLAHLAMVGHVGLEGEGGDAVGGAMAGVET